MSRLNLNLYGGIEIGSHILVAVTWALVKDRHILVLFVTRFGIVLGFDDEPVGCVMLAGLLDIFNLVEAIKHAQALGYGDMIPSPARATRWTAYAELSLL